MGVEGRAGDFRDSQVFEAESTERSIEDQASSGQIIRLLRPPHSSCVLAIELTYGRGGGRGAKSYDRLSHYK